MRPILAAFVCLTLVPNLNAVETKPDLQTKDATDKTTSEQLKKLDGQLDDARVRGDKTAYERLLADDMLEVDAEGDVQGKAEVLKWIKPSPAGVKMSLVAEDVQVRVLGHTAVVVSLKTLTWETNNKPHSNKYRESNTYAWKNGRWQVIASQRARESRPYVAKDVMLSLKIDETFMRGNKDATIVIVELSDYQCPFCRKFAGETLKQIEQNYIDTGRVGFVFRDYPLEAMHPFAFKAAVAARCAAQQGQFWAMNQLLLQEPMSLTQDNLVADAETLKLDVTKFQKCLADEKTSMALRQDMAEADALGITGTPNFLIGVRKPNDTNVKVLRMVEGGYPFAVFKATLDTIIAAQTP